MSGEIRFPVVGNLTTDPTLNFTQGGTPVVNLAIASTSREFDRQAGQMAKGDTTFVRCVAWREFAEHISNTLTKGMRVVAFGRLRQRSYRPVGSTEDRTVWELELEAIGPDLRWATATVQRVDQGPPQPASQSWNEPSTWDDKEF